MELKSDFIDYHAHKKDRKSDIILEYYLSKEVEIGFNTKDFIPNHIILNEGEGDFAIIGELEIDDQIYLNGDYYSEELAKKLGISEETIAEIKARAKNDAVEELKKYLKKHPEEIPELSYRGY